MFALLEQKHVELIIVSVESRSDDLSVETIQRGERERDASWFAFDDRVSRTRQ